MVGIVVEAHFRIGPGGQLAGEGHAVIGRLIGNLIPGAGEDVVRINLAVVAAAVAADGGNIKGVLRDVSIDDLAVVLKADARFLNEGIGGGQGHAAAHIVRHKEHDGGPGRGSAEGIHRSALYQMLTIPVGGGLRVPALPFVGDSIPFRVGGAGGDCHRLTGPDHTVGGVSGNDRLGRGLVDKLKGLFLPRGGRAV